MSVSALSILASCKEEEEEKRTSIDEEASTPSAEHQTTKEDQRATNDSNPTLCAVQVLFDTQLQLEEDKEKQKAQVAEQATTADGKKNDSGEGSPKNDEPTSSSSPLKRSLSEKRSPSQPSSPARRAFREPESPSRQRHTKYADQQRQNRRDIRRMLLNERIATLLRLETLGRTNLENEEAALATHLAREAEIEKQQAERGQRARQRQTQVSPERARDPSIDAYLDFLQRRVVDKETQRIQKDRRERVSELLYQNRRSEDLRAELQVRKDYTQLIANEVDRQEKERSLVMHERSMAIKHEVASEVERNIDAQRQWDQEESSRRVQQVHESVAYVKEKGNYPFRVEIAEKSKVRVQELKKESDHIRRGFVKKAQQDSSAQMRRRASSASLASVERTRTLSSTSSTDTPFKSMQQQQQPLQQSSHDRPSGDTSTSPPKVQFAAEDNDEARRRSSASPRGALVERRGSKHAAQQHTLKRHRKRAILKQFSQAETERTKVIEKHLKKREDEREQQKVEAEEAQRRGEEAHEHRMQQHEYDRQQKDLNHQARLDLQKKIKASGEERRRMQRLEAAEKSRMLKERLDAVQKAKAEKSREERSLWLHDVQRSQEAHNSRVETTEKIEAEEREKARAEYLQRHEAAAAEQQELLLLREQRQSEDSRRWNERYHAKNERAEVAKLQKLVRNRNRVMAEKADSLMAKEAIEISRANQRVKNREKVEQRQLEASTRVDYKRKTLLGLYGNSSRSQQSTRLNSPTARDDDVASTAADDPEEPRPVPNLSPIKTIDAKEDQSHVAAAVDVVQDDDDDENDAANAAAEKPSALNFIWEHSPVSVPFLTVMTTLIKDEEEHVVGDDEKEEDKTVSALHLLATCWDGQQTNSQHQVALVSILADLHDGSEEQQQKEDTSPQQQSETTNKTTESEAEQHTDTANKSSQQQQSSRYVSKFHDSVSKKRPPGYEPRRVIPLHAPATIMANISQPSLAYPTQALLSTAKIAPELREKITRMMELQAEVDREERLKWRAKSGMKRHQSVVGGGAAGDDASGQGPPPPLVVSKPSDRLTQRSVTQDAKRVFQKKESVPPTIHDNIPPVKEVSRRLYNPDLPLHKRMLTETDEQSHLQMKGRPPSQKSEELFVQRYYEEPLRLHNKVLEQSYDRALAAGMQFNEDGSPRRSASAPLQVDPFQHAEIVNRLYSPALKKREKELKADEALAAKKKKTTSRNRNKLAAAAHADRFYSAQIEKTRTNNQQLSKEHLKPLTPAPKKLGPGDFDEAMERLYRGAIQ